MRRRASIVSTPVGMFAGQEPLPQGLSEATHRDLIEGMSGDPGLRLAGGTGRRTHKGGLLTVQHFAGGTPGGSNSADALEVAPIKRNKPRSAIGRGYPEDLG